MKSNMGSEVHFSRFLFKSFDFLFFLFFYITNDMFARDLEMAF